MNSRSILATCTATSPTISWGIRFLGDQIVGLGTGFKKVDSPVPRHRLAADEPGAECNDFRR